MKTKTVEELRSQARKQGLKGYAKMRKEELLKLLNLGAKNKLPDTSAVSRKKPARTSSTKQKTGASPTSGQKKTSRPKSADTRAQRGYAQPVSNNGEQQIESAKYTFTPPSLERQHFEKQVDLGEDIDQLPAIHTPLLCLLPQKPGVLLGYWMLPDLHSETPLRLRLGLITGEQTMILEEQPLQTNRGSWYFQIEKYTDLASVYLQLGRYLPDGQFVSAIARGVARIPNLYASTRADRQWWLSEAHLRELLRRNQGRALGWRTVDGLASSPGKHLSWFSGSGTR